MDKGAAKPINPNEAIALQQRANIYNQTTPFGSINYQLDQGGSKNDNRITVSLTPEQQAILEAQQTAQLLSAETATGRFADLGTGRTDVEKASFDRAMALI
jgi:hypothetical protein